jgi:DNA-directed RNA polymerase subunit RPC12/RpoP
MAKTIKCNQCGSADLAKLEEYEYKCRYCNSRIVVEKPKLDLGSFAKTFNTQNLYRTTQTAYTPSGEVIKKASGIGCLMIAIIGIGILSGIIVPIIISMNKTSPETETTSDGWQLSYTPQVFYANGSKGGVIWKFTEENYDWKKNRTVLTIFDPIKNKELKREIIIAEHEGSYDGPSLWDMYNGGKIFGDTIFFTPKNGGLSGKNMYTGKVVVDNKYIQKQIGYEVAEARAYANTKDNYISIKDAEGTEYYYFPSLKKIIKQDDYRDRKKSKQVSKYYFVLSGNNDKKHVLRVLQEMSELETPSYFSSTSYADFKKEKTYYQKYRQTFNIDSIPVSHGFFNAEIISWNDSSFIIQYTKNLLEGSPITFAKFDLAGKELWSVMPEKIKAFQPVANNPIKTTPDYDFNVLGNALIIYMGSPHKAACSINVHSGKTDWTFQCLK